MGTARNIAAAAIGSLLALTILTGCFTGVESTPRISYKEVKEKNAEVSSPEETLAASFIPERYSQWTTGKDFFVTSPRIALVLNAEAGTASMPVEGDTLRFNGSRTATDLTGKEVVELLFTSGGTAHTFVYRTNASAAELSARSYVEVPFTIDLALLATVRNAIAGKSLFIRTPLWVDRQGNALKGRKFINVTIKDVLPANEVYPYMVTFSDDTGRESAVYMSASAGTRWAARDFPALFSMTDPRINYPRITDAVWNDIINSRVSKGMTKMEASLALGTPINIDRGHDHTAAYERWSYPDGIYLIFEDGLLVQFNK